MKKRNQNKKHNAVIAILCVALTSITIFLIHVNQSDSGMFLSKGHFILLLISILTLWILLPQKIMNKIWKKKNENEFDFGWSPKWIHGFKAASILTFLLAVYTYFSLADLPIIQFITYSLLLLLSVNFFIGNVILSNSGKTTQITLPLVEILPDGGDKILDAGCGAGRTTIAIAKAIPKATITAFDKFDAEYIESGGLQLLKQNLNLAGIESRIQIVTGDILKTKFNDNQFDAIVSTFMIDHLPNGKQQALCESYRILKPGGRFLLIVAVRGYTTFGIASFMSLFMTSQKTWKIWIEQSGFRLIHDGRINEGHYFYFEKPILI